MVRLCLRAGHTESIDRDGEEERQAKDKTGECPDVERNVSNAGYVTVSATVIILPLRYLGDTMAMFPWCVLELAVFGSIWFETMKQWESSSLSLTCFCAGISFLIWYNGYGQQQ